MHQSKKYLALLTTCAFAALTATSDVSAETYRLIHAIGNSEKELGRDLTKSECERRKSEAKRLAKRSGRTTKNAVMDQSLAYQNLSSGDLKIDPIP